MFVGNAGTKKASRTSFVNFGIHDPEKINHS